MSPTSYRTAPPRTLIVTTAEHRVKPRAGAGCLGERSRNHFPAERMGRDSAAQRVQWIGRVPAEALDERPLRMPHADHSAAMTLRNRLLEPLLHLGVALTGVGTVLLGSILPRLSAQWHLRDKDAGPTAAGAVYRLRLRSPVGPAQPLEDSGLGLRAFWRRWSQYFSAATKIPASLCASMDWASDWP